MHILFFALIFSSLYFPVQAADIVSARFTTETERYDHCVLGDCIEYSALEASLDDGRVISYQLDDDSVFEDIKPRLIPMGLNGRKALLVVRTYIDRGAALVVLDQRSGKLVIVAESPPIGLAHRWQNPIGVADFDHDGKLEIATVITPHIGGTLTLYERQGDKLVKDHELYPFSNHKMGSSQLDLTEIIDWNMDNVADIILPDVTHHQLRVVSFSTGKGQIIDQRTLSSSIKGPIQPFKNGVKYQFHEGGEGIWTPALNPQ